MQKEANHSGTLAPSKRFGANAPIRPKSMYEILYLPTITFCTKFCNRKFWIHIWHALMYICKLNAYMALKFYGSRSHFCPHNLDIQNGGATHKDNETLFYNMPSHIG